MFSLRIKSMDKSQSDAVSDIQTLVHDFKPESAKLLKLKQGFCAAVADLYHAKKMFLETLQQLKEENTTPELTNLIEEYQNLKFNKEQGYGILELENSNLSSYFKLYLVTSKALLDKFIPFVKSIHKLKPNEFKDMGNTLIEQVQHKYKGPNGPKIIEVLKAHKKEYLDYLIGMRNKFVHNSDLDNYVGFYVHIKDGKAVTSLQEMNKYQPAESFIQESYKELLQLVRQLLELFEINKVHEQ
jgi:hypothetical protein